jgi:chromosome segregation ATPase
MEVIIKYTKTEKTTIEADIIENLKSQLKAKESDRLVIAEYINTLECENKELTNKMSKCENECKTLNEENKRLKEEVDRIRYSAIETYTTNEKELVTEVSTLNEQLEDINNKLKEEKMNSKEFECKLQDELVNSRQKDSVIKELEQLVEKQKTELVLLRGVKEEKSDVESNMESYMKRIDDLVKHNKELLAECSNLELELQAKRTECMNVLESYRSEQETNRIMAEKLTMLQDKKNYLQESIKQAENKISSLSEENEVLRKTSDKERFVPQEIKYKQKISRLEEQVTLLSENSNIKLASQVVELEAELKRKINSEKELNDITRRYEVLQQEHREVLNELEKYKMNEVPTDLTKECARIKRDRDTLLQVAVNAKDIATKYEQLKVELEEVRKVYEELKRIHDANVEDKVLLEEQLKVKTSENLELEKSITRLEEKISTLQEQHTNDEKLI